MNHARKLIQRNMLECDIYISNNLFDKLFEFPWEVIWIQIKLSCHCFMQSTAVSTSDSSIIIRWFPLKDSIFNFLFDFEFCLWIHNHSIDLDRIVLNLLTKCNHRLICDCTKSRSEVIYVHAIFSIPFDVILTILFNKHNLFLPFFVWWATYKWIMMH
jgi:hypothetical protein